VTDQTQVITPPGPGPDGGPPPGAGPGGPLVKRIVPLAGLPIIAVILIGLVLSMANDWRWGLDFFHVAGGGLWTAIDLFVGLIIGPILGGLSIPARAEFSARFMPKMLLIMPTLVVCTLAAGFQLAITMGNLDPASPNHDRLIVSFVIVGVMAIIALGILEPANVTVLFEMRKPQPNPELIGRMMKRFVYTAGITGALQVITLIIMTRVATP
jgi:hypothetical protein